MGFFTTLPRIDAQSAGPTVVITIEAPLGDHPDGSLKLRDRIVKATAEALTRHKTYLWAYGGGFNVHENDRVDIRTTVTVRGERRFYVVRDADKKTARGIAAEIGEAETGGAGSFSYSDMLGYIIHQHPRMKAIVPVVRTELQLIGLFWK
ncbi:MAG: hypothetical protein WC889_12630, partial [Myxococcota bacterium]